MAHPAPPAPPREDRRERIAGFVAAMALAMLVWTGLATSGRAGGPPVPDVPSAADLDAPLPLDPDVEIDSLDNGLRYYVRESSNPGKTVELRLAVDAGSLLEDDDQRGLAHAVEHMAFRGTRRFRHQALVTMLQSFGLRAGDDLNAYTTPDETVFRLTIPTDRPEALDRGFEILADWASGVTFDSIDAAQERGIVLAERRSDGTADGRVDQARDSAFLAGSSYEHRAAIGDVRVLERFDPAAMRRFYTRWYRPDLLGVVAVGDLPTPKLRELVERHFGALRRPDSAPHRPRPDVAVPARGRTVVLTDPELRTASVDLWLLEPRLPTRTVADLRAHIVQQLYASIMDERLERLPRDSASVILDASTDQERIVRPLRALALQADVAVDGVTKGVETMLAAAQVAARDGFSAAELARHRRVMLRDAQRSLDNAERIHASDLADECVAHFLRDDPLMAAPQRDALYAEILPTIQLEEVDRLARRMADDRGRTIVITAPAAIAARLPGDSAIAALAAAVRARPLPRWRVDSGDTPLLSRPPEPGRIAQERVIPESGVTEWTLGNGMRVLLRPTSFRADQILLSARAPGGASLAGDADYQSAYMSDVVVRANGIGAFDAPSLERVLAGQAARVSAHVSDDAVELTGEGSALEAEQLFQLVYLYFTAPRSDPSAFRGMVGGRYEEITHRAADPDEVFRDTLAVTLAQHHPRARPASIVTLAQLDERRALDFYRARFGNATNFTVVLVGNVMPDRMRPLVERYLASLPAGVREAPRDDGRRFPTGVVQRTVVRGADARAVTRLAFTGALPRDATSWQLLTAVRDLLELRLEARLRESLGGTYGVDVDLDRPAEPRSEYLLSVEFTADPRQLDSLVAAAFAEIERLRERGPTAAEAARVVAAEARDARMGLERNEYWRSEIVSHAHLGWPLSAIQRHAEEIEKLDAKTLRDGVRQFVDPRRYVRVSRVPAR